MSPPSPADTKNADERSFRKVLVANRGEIAVRVIRGLRELGIRSAVVYSDADRASLPVLLSDEAHRIGPAPSSESYLRGEAIVALAQEIGADAIHPGYGFLSENAEFAGLCEEKGVVFVGPPSSAIAAMGSKIESRRLMIDAGVPVVPGGRDPLEDADEALAFAEEVGYPVMLKASAGGGGKGMRRVESAEDLAQAFREARSEAVSSFGDGAIYLEKLIEEPRHVEIQILGDRHGKVVSLCERECSLQRRNQKVVEEAPSPVVGPELRKAMGEAAVRAAAAVGYFNAGTVEFLLDKNHDFFFLEMNTRLQVEHPVTELVTGLDLVHAQIHVAQGGALGEEFDDVAPRGHAVELRLYAEDPARGFSPSPGKIEILRWPEGPGIRNDAGVYEGARIPIYYDPMIAKLVAWGASREIAIARLERALHELRLEGIAHNVPLFRRILADEDFRAGEMDITMLERKMDDGTWMPSAKAQETADAENDLPLVAAAIAHHQRQQQVTSLPPASSGGAGHRGAWKRAARSEAVGDSSWS